MAEKKRVQETHFIVNTTVGSFEFVRNIFSQ